MSRAKGNAAEARAAAFLKAQGFAIIEQNYYAKKMGDQKDDVLHFVEVKSGEGFEAVYNLTPTKLSRVIKSAELYLKHKGLDTAYCIDAVIVSGETIEYLENITL